MHYGLCPRLVSFFVGVARFQLLIRLAHLDGSEETKVGTSLGDSGMMPETLAMAFLWIPFCGGVVDLAAVATGSFQARAGVANAGIVVGEFVTAIALASCRYAGPRLEESSRC